MASLRGLVTEANLCKDLYNEVSCVILWIKDWKFALNKLKQLIHGKIMKH